MTIPYKDEKDIIKQLRQNVGINDQLRIALVNSKKSYLESLEKQGYSPYQALVLWQEQINSYIKNMDDTVKSINDIEDSQSRD